MNIKAYTGQRRGKTVPTTGKRDYQTGDRVVYHMPKHGRSPGRRAKDITPTSSGGDFNYVVDKYWVVSDVLPDNVVIARTRRGKTHMLSPDDPNLRCAHWWERLIFRRRFPTEANDHALIGKRTRTAEHLVWSGDGYRGQVLLGGTTRSAVSPRPLPAGEPCEITGRKHATLTLIVQPLRK